MEYQSVCHHHQQQPMPQGGMVSAVAPASIAEALGLQPGDMVLAVDTLTLRDVIDYRFATASEQIEVLVHHASGTTLYEIEKDADEDLGIHFLSPLFEPLHTCKNHCPFCFLAQMPRGMRKTLYLKDDDYRLSFLYGNFVTLTNLTEHDWQRIESQHLSPLHISIHATDMALRAHLLGKPDIPDVLAQIRRLGRAGIQVHTQVVLCPGLNDGAALHQTVQELATLSPVVQSIAVVPVGLTRYYQQHRQQRQRHQAAPLHAASESTSIAQGFCTRLPATSALPLRCYTPTEASQLLDTLLPYSTRYQRDYGCHLVYPADEFYLLAQHPLPPASFYDGYPQYSNGVGMTRELLDGWKRARRRLPRSQPVQPKAAETIKLALVCGTLIAPTLQRIAHDIAQRTGLYTRLLPVVNDFFGDTVTVSGLLVGHDVVQALRGSGYTHALLPGTMFDHEGTRTLDEYTPQRIAAEAGLVVQPVGTLDDLIAFLTSFVNR